jgi:hypothetical protein
LRVPENTIFILSRTLSFFSLDREELLAHLYVVPREEGEGLSRRPPISAGASSPATSTARRPGATADVHPDDQRSGRDSRADSEHDVLDHRVEGCPITGAPQTGCVG